MSFIIKSNEEDKIFENSDTSLIFFDVVVLFNPTFLYKKYCYIIIYST